MKTAIGKNPVCDYRNSFLGSSPPANQPFPPDSNLSVYDRVKLMPISPSSVPSNHDPVSRRQKIWLFVSRSPMASLWNLEGVPPRVILKNTWNSIFSDNLLGRSAELGFYFLFALFPMLFSACSILGMAARSAPKIYNSLLLYLAIVVPSTALGTVLQTFNQTTAAASSDKLTFGLAAAIWSASVGFSAIQDSLNVVYRVKETRPYWKARLSAIGVTIILSVL